MQWIVVTGQSITPANGPSTLFVVKAFNLAVHEQTNVYKPIIKSLDQVAPYKINPFGSLLTEK